MIIDRRWMLRAVAGAGIMPVAGRRAAQAQGAAGETPIVLVHGNGDHAALWQTLIWRFQSNGYPREKLFAFNFTDPVARDIDEKPQPNRSSTEDQLRELTAQIDRVLEKTGAPKVALVGSSRGGNAIRNYVSQPERAQKVSHIVLCGTPNHGVFDWAATIGNEFNAKGAFLTRLNSTPDEIVPGPQFLTLRSDGMDKYAQPDGRLLGQPGVPTRVTFDGPALAGATNLVLGALDHRETAFHPRAFREIYRFILGREPDRIAIVPEREVRLSGLVTGMAGVTPTNRPLEGARVQIFPISPYTGLREDAALWSSTVDATGAWGPMIVSSSTPLEFVVAADGHPTTHIYRSTFPRSCDIIHLRPGRPLSATERNAGATIVVSRPRGYFGLPRDSLIVDGLEPRDVTRGVPTDSITTLPMPEFEDRLVVCSFNEERIICRPWSAPDNHLTIVEMTY